MTAGLATLNFLKKNPAVYSKIDRLGAATRAGLAKIFSEHDIACEVSGTGSIFMPHFGASAVRDANDVATSDKGALHRYHLALMAAYGMFFLPSKMGAISYAHDDADIKRLLSATEQICGSGILSSSN
jgi:glutamate-1-semialdehyde 2,1-aminomutase